MGVPLKPVSGSVVAKFVFIQNYSILSDRFIMACFKSQKKRYVVFDIQYQNSGLLASVRSDELRYVLAAFHI